MITSSQQRIDELTRLGWWGKTTLHELLSQRVAEHPKMLAVADQPNRQTFTSDSAYRLDYSELDHAVCNLASQLLELGIREGDSLIVQLPNIVELVVIYFSASIIGAVVSPLPVQYGRHELNMVCEALLPAAMITVKNMKDTPLAEIARTALPASVPIFVFGASDVSGVETILLDMNSRPENLERVQYHLKCHPADANAILTICWTSGTTGTPKGVPRSHNMWLATARNTSEAGQYRTGDCLLNPFPLVNMAAIGGFLFPLALHGTSLILHHPFDPVVFLQQMEMEKVTFTIVPPVVLNQLAKSKAMWNSHDFSRLRRIGSGSAPLAPWMIKIFDESYQKQIVNFYGSNEGISLFSTPETSARPEVRASMFPRMGCEGMPWTGITHEMVGTRIVKVGSEEEITEPDEPGELLFYGATVFDGYFGSSDESVFTSDGWFHTGDLVEICGDLPNYYRIVGRCKDIINRGGMKISPTEIDILLEAFPDLVEGAVCSYSDKDLGERVCACIVISPDSEAPSLAQINSFLLGKGLAKFKLPEKLLLLESLPRNPLGKVIRNQLEKQEKQYG